MLAKDLLGVTLVPETTVQSAPDVTSSPPVDQEVPTGSQLTPFGFGLDPPSDFALVDALIEASPNPLGYRMRSTWDRLTDVPTKATILVCWRTVISLGLCLALTSYGS
jgi:hypothetical protein